MKNLILMLVISCLAVHIVNSLSISDVLRRETRELVNINGTMYYISTALNGTADAALSLCNDLGMKMISIQTAAKHQMISGYLTEHGHNDAFWLSGLRFTSSDFIWSGSGERVTYTNWYPGEPSSSDECIFMSTGGTTYDRRWFGSSCLAVVKFLCEEIDNCNV